MINYLVDILKIPIFIYGAIKVIMILYKDEANSREHIQIKSILCCCVIKAIIISLTEQ